MKLYTVQKVIEIEVEADDEEDAIHEAQTTSVDFWEDYFDATVVGVVE